MTTDRPLRQHARATFGLARLDRTSLAAIARVEVPQIVRVVIVAAVSWQACIWLGATVAPIYAVLVPLVSLKADPFSAFNLSWSRLVGVIGGLLIGVAVTQVVSLDLLAMTVVLGLSLLIGMVVRVGNAPNLQIAISALLIFVSPDAGAYGLTRLWETGVGTVVTAGLTPFLFPADPLRAARDELRGVGGDADRRAAGLGGHRRRRGPVHPRAHAADGRGLRTARRRHGPHRHLQTQIASAARSGPVERAAAARAAGGRAARPGPGTRRPDRGQHPCLRGRGDHLRRTRGVRQGPHPATRGPVRPGRSAGRRHRVGLAGRSDPDELAGPPRPAGPSSRPTTPRSPR